MFRERDREAFDEMREDARLVAEIAGPDSGVRVEIAPRRIVLPNGSTIQYRGGRVDDLIEWCRGRQFHQIDGVEHLPFELRNQFLLSERLS